MNPARLLFVYNADSGLFNTLTDIAHKAFSPSTYNCSLCAITHDLLKEKGEWKQFVSELKMETEFLHKDEFVKKYGRHSDQFPAIYLVEGENLKLTASADDIKAMTDIDQLKQKVKTLL